MIKAIGTSINVSLFETDLTSNNVNLTARKMLSSVSP